MVKLATNCLQKSVKSVGVSCASVVKQRSSFKIIVLARLEWIDSLNHLLHTPDGATASTCFVPCTTSVS